MIIELDWNWSVSQHSEGVYYVHDAGGETGPYPSEQDARDDITVYLCCNCLDELGLFDNECEDWCSISLEHGGLCHEKGPETDEHCSRCGAHGFVKEHAAGDF